MDWSKQHGHTCGQGRPQSWAEPEDQSFWNQGGPSLSFLIQHNSESMCVGKKGAGEGRGVFHLHPQPLFSDSVVNGAIVRAESPFIDWLAPALPLGWAFTRLYRIVEAHLQVIRCRSEASAIPVDACPYALHHQHNLRHLHPSCARNPG